MEHTSEGPSAWKADEIERIYGKVMPNAKELRAIREKAKKAGEDPDMAEIVYLKRLDEANARHRAVQEERARQSAERNLREKLK